MTKHDLEQLKQVHPQLQSFTGEAKPPVPRRRLDPQGKKITNRRLENGTMFYTRTIKGIEVECEICFRTDIWEIPKGGFVSYYKEKKYRCLPCLQQYLVSR